VAQPFFLCCRVYPYLRALDAPLHPEHPEKEVPGCVLVDPPRAIAV
jgi:hypothetical protein